MKGINEVKKDLRELKKHVHALRRLEVACKTHEMRIKLLSTLKQTERTRELIRVERELIQAIDVGGAFDSAQRLELYYIDKINKLRHSYLTDKFRGTRRLNLKVHYITGATGTGKSRDILDEHGDENVYRVTDYQHPFDSYQCQDVIVFEEFRSSIRLQDMLNYLDIYPVTLPARYSPKVACFSEIYVVSNWTFEMQYSELQKDPEQKSSYEAWIRRFNGVVKEYTKSGIITYPTIQDYLKRNEEFRPVTDEDEMPFN